MLSSKKFTCKGLRTGVYLSEAQNPHTPPPLHTVSLYTVYIFTQGRGGELTRKRVRGATVHKAVSKISK